MKKGQGHRWKVYSPKGEYLASTRYLGDSTMLVAGRGLGHTICVYTPRGLRAVWTEGVDGQSSLHPEAVAAHVQHVLVQLRAEYRNAI